MLQLGIIRLSQSQWSSPLHMKPKVDSSGSRPCDDFRHLNTSTILDRYLILHIHDLATDTSFFTKFDLIKAYYEIPVEENDIPKTAITIPFGQFKFTQMPFGLRNATQSF